LGQKHSAIIKHKLTFHLRQDLCFTLDSKPMVLIW